MLNFASKMQSSILFSLIIFNFIMLLLSGIHLCHHFGFSIDHLFNVVSHHDSPTMKFCLNVSFITGQEVQFKYCLKIWFQEIEKIENTHCLLKLHST